MKPFPTTKGIMKTLEVNIPTKPLLLKQRQFLKSDKRFVLYSGGIGAGKTICGCIKSIFSIAKYPNSLGLICAPTYPMLSLSTMRTFDKICPDELIHNRKINEKIYTFVNGSQIAFRSLDKEHKLRGPNISWIYVDEGTEIKKDIFLQLLGRLRESENAQIFMTTNPSGYGNYLYEDYVEKPSDNTEVIFTNTLENIYLPKDYVEDLKKTYTGDFYKRFVLGEWGSIEGLIYKEFSPSVHVLTQMPEFTDKDQFYIGIDWGVSNPTAILFMYRREDEWYVVREYYLKDAPAYVHAENIKIILRELNIELKNVAGILIDPSAQGLKLELKLNGIYCTNAKNDVWQGINKIQSCLINKKLFISYSCKNLIKEFQSYKINERAQTKETPIKENDHCLDALRYVIYTVSKPYIKAL